MFDKRTSSEEPIPKQVLKAARGKGCKAIFFVKFSPKVVVQ
jgi:hypothetical protein